MKQKTWRRGLRRLVSVLYCIGVLVTAAAIGIGPYQSKRELCAFHSGGMAGSIHGPIVSGYSAGQTEELEAKGCDVNAITMEETSTGWVEQTYWLDGISLKLWFTWIALTFVAPLIVLAVIAVAFSAVLWVWNGFAPEK